MKTGRIITAIAFLLTNSSTVFGQDDQKPKADVENKDAEKLFEQISKKSNSNLGILYLTYKKGAEVKVKNPDAETKIKIESAHIILEKGRLQRITVNVKDHIGYYQNEGGISITNFQKCLDFKLNYMGSDPTLQKTYLELGQILGYMDVMSRPVYPPNYEVTLDEEKRADTIKLQTSPLEFFDVRTYTDAKGLTGEANGLAQTEINAHFIGNTQSTNGKHITWLPYVNMNFSASKFSSEFDTLKLQSFAERTNQDMLNFIRYSSLSFKVELELLRYSRIHDGYLTLGHQLFSTKTRDTLATFKRLYTPAFYIIAGGTMFSLPRIKCDFKMPMYFAYLGDQPFTNYSQNCDFFIVPEIELIIDPTSSNENSDKKTEFDSNGAKVFARLRYYDMPNYRGGNFLQLQIGATGPLKGSF